MIDTCANCGHLRAMHHHVVATYIGVWFCVVGKCPCPAYMAEASAGSATPTGDNDE